MGGARAVPPIAGTPLLLAGRRRPRRERDLQELFRRAKKPVALFVDDAHDLHPKTLVALKRLAEVVVEGGGQPSVVLVGHARFGWRSSPSCPPTIAAGGHVRGHFDTEAFRHALEHR